MQSRERFRILITDPLLNRMVDETNKNFPEYAPKMEFVLVERGDEEELIDKISGVDILVGARNRMGRKLFEKADRLFFIQQCSAGYDNIDLKAAREKGIDVSNAGGAGVIPVAEHTIMLMLAISKNLIRSHNTMKAGEWIFGECIGKVYELRDKVLGIIGLGQIGSQVARLGHCFGMKLQYFDPFRADASNVGLPISKVSLEDLLKTSDFVSIHALLTPETRKLIGRKELEMMKETAFLINTSRGAIVDEEALADVLQARKSGAGEPLTEATVALIKGQYKLMYFFGYKQLGSGDERLELYDIESDPEELNDLASSKRGTAAEMLEEIKSKLTEVNRPYL